MTAHTIEVRDARQEDVALMARWAQAMALETEGKHLDGATVLRGIQRGFDDPNKGRYFLAESDGQPAGMLMLTWEWSDWRDGWWWWIQSVYTAKAFRRSGVYRALYAHVLALAKADPDVRGIRLYVERENTDALRTYQDLGMLDAGYAMFETSFVDYGGTR
jgi:ribosomal protein S18 acetylase RimI-like enzyme